MRSSLTLPPVPRVSRDHLLLDLIIMVSSLFLSLYLRVGPTEFVDHFETAIFFLPIVILVRVAALVAFGCYNVMWRYISLVDVIDLAKAILTSTLVIVSITFFLGERFSRLPRSVYVIDAMVMAMGLLSARLARRIQYEKRGQSSTPSGQKTLIYGAGNNGRILANRFRSDAALDIHLVGFIDDDSKKKGMVINGARVLGSRSDLAHILRTSEATQLIIALPELPGEVLREVTQIARRFNIRPRITTRLNSVTAHTRNVDIYRDININDLLNRPAKEIDLSAIREMVRGRVVLVTGAGGSIGSELSRQLKALAPGQLLLLDHSEFNLYEIDKELRLATHDVQTVVPLLADIQDEHAVMPIFQSYRPDIVFHAAAYKHVHLTETNPHSAILNNILGTQTLLRAAELCDASTFIMISSDKAVNPAGIMGSTKRVCELLVTASALRTKKRFGSVRFGNVLGSSGSLIPLLQKQISEGSPVTITHPEMTRFFMLIPEAVMLVLKASTITHPGDIHVLRMGEPVKIVDIASSLISLMGRSETENPIVFTGLRPGEKMFEELYIRGDELTTEHPDILTVPNGDTSFAADDAQSLLEKVAKLILAAKNHSTDAADLLLALVRSTYLAPADTHRDYADNSPGQHKAPNIPTRSNH